MTNGNDDETPPSPQKSHLNQNLVIAIIGAAATLLAAILPWALDRAAKAEPSPTAIQATFTAFAPLESTATNTDIPASLTPTLEPPTVTATLTEETGIYNAYLAFDFEGTFIDNSFRKDQTIYLFFDFNDPKGRNDIKVVVSVIEVPGTLVDTVAYQIRDKFQPPTSRLAITKGNLNTGKYKVDLYLNNNLEETLEFTVTE